MSDLPLPEALILPVEVVRGSLDLHRVATTNDRGEAALLDYCIALGESHEALRALAFRDESGHRAVWSAEEVTALEAERDAMIENYGDLTEVLDRERERVARLEAEVATLTNELADCEKWRRHSQAARWDAELIVDHHESVTANELSLALARAEEVAALEAKCDGLAQAAAWYHTDLSAERAKVEPLIEALEGLLRGCEVYESAFDTDEGWAFYDGSKRFARAALARVRGPEPAVDCGVEGCATRYGPNACPTCGSTDRDERRKVYIEMPDQAGGLGPCPDSFHARSATPRKG